MAWLVGVTVSHYVMWSFTIVSLGGISINSYFFIPVFSSSGTWVRYCVGTKIDIHTRYS